MTRRLTLTLLAALLPAAGAQTAQDIIGKVDATQKAARDVTFRLSGTASLDTSAQKVDLTIKAIPAQSLARVQFAAPDALADNVVVADKNEIRQYMYLTNQITVTSAQKAASQAGLGLDFTQLSNTADLLSNYNVKLVGTTGAAGKRLYQLEATAKSGGTDRTRVWITEAGWRPTRIQLVGSNGRTLADLTVSNYKVNSGLTASAIRMLPKDAQIIKQ
ncbi:outer membrane lipoprotein carrier protein LolA [Deinococcus taeanensis]|uniref:outer membrane lipoprotein carrier protein LolA n=1 Tax=Deinococcus taeanensis TaxID=2737050 RepID=UPI001CDCAAE5|nr:outer membrane lipoprotein carrier protein LolA [Deinococcus taeanensis]UBV41533.1 outer membrane lipoprotein carrier protein LolA [Deinococcus taeanensis]